MLQHFVGAADPEEGILLAGEAGAGQILRCSAGTHRHRYRRQAAAHRQLTVAFRHQVFQLRRKRLRLDGCADGGAGSLQRLQILAIELLQQELQVPLYAGFSHKGAVALGSQGEAGRHAHAGVDQFAQRRTLATD